MVVIGAPGTSEDADGANADASAAVVSLEFLGGTVLAICRRERVDLYSYKDIIK